MKRYLSRCKSLLVFTLLTILLGGAAAQGGTQVEAQGGVQIITHPALGEILGGPEGMTLYVLSKETASDLICVEDCTENWPPYLVDSGTVLSEPFGLVRREQNEDSRAIVEYQLSYKDQPLYYWSRDKQAGDVTGDGIGGIWQVARP